MRKLSLLLISILVLMGTGGIAAAAPMTWTDVIDFNPDRLVPPTLSYHHSIADDGFTSYWMDNENGDDQVFSYDLEVEIYDDNQGSWRRGWLGGLVYIHDYGEAAAIWTAGGVYSYNFAFSSNTYNNDGDLHEFLGIADIYHDGTLNVSISSWYGDFYVASSTLTAHGDNGTDGMAPVPEPATMILMGLGLVGLAGVSRKKLLKK